MIAGIPTPFGRSWEELTLEDLRAFFDHADEEGWTWEAKGTRARPEHVQQAASAFGNSVEGGYLVLGARRRDGASGPWIVDGVNVGPQPRLWVTSALMNDAVRPVPAYDTKAFELDEGLSVVVVNFRPAAVPPVITNNGQVWERLSGASQQVKDPATLRTLVERGQHALDEASRATDEAVGAFFGDAIAVHYSLVVVMAAVGATGDVTTKVFRESVHELALRLVRAAPEAAPHRVGGDLGQGRLRVWSYDSDEAPIRLVEVSRHGPVTVALGSAIVDDGLRAVAQSVEVLRPYWADAAAVVAELSSVGLAHVRVAVRGKARGVTAASRWTNSHEPSQEDLLAIQRELRRSLGMLAWEPDNV